MDNGFRSYRKSGLRESAVAGRGKGRKRPVAGQAGVEWCSVARKLLALAGTESESGPVGWQGKWEGTRGYFGRNRSQCPPYITSVYCAL